MIYMATWEDGRQTVLRAADEEAARLLAQSWRTNDPMLDPSQSPTKPATIEHIQSRGPVGIVLAGWENP